MNKRIRELQSKSYLMCKQIVDDDGHVVVTPDRWFDTFAELLIKECIGVMEITDITDFRGIELTLKIKEHFGVE